MPSAPSTHASFTWRQWAICLIAALGFAFDVYELLMLPLVGPPALSAILRQPLGSPEILRHMGWLAWVPAVAGGTFGLLGGYLVDTFGRRRVLTWSIVLYSVSAAAAGFATTFAELLVLRSLTFIGVCVEFVAAVAWLSELFDDPRVREKVVGYTQAAGSLGGLLVAASYGAALRWQDHLPAIHGAHEAWRYTLLSGLIPAIPLLLVRPFLPESPRWVARQAAGTLVRPQFAALFTPELRNTTVVTTLLMATTLAVGYGALQQMSQVLPGLPAVRGLDTVSQQQVVKDLQIWQEGGGILGRLALAYLAARVASRRRLLRGFQLTGLAAVPSLFLLAPRLTITQLEWLIALGGGCLAGQISFWGNYLPRVFPLHLRGTGESVPANIGGRMMGTFAGMLTASVAPWLFAPATALTGSELMAARAWGLGRTAALVAAVSYVAGLALTMRLPEPTGPNLPD